jgi:hypothetical protein
MEKSPQKKKKSHLTSEEIYVVQTSPLLVPTLSSMNPVHTITSYLPKINLIWSIYA